MLSSITKYASIFFCAYYVYAKSQQVDTKTREKYYIGVVLSLILGGTAGLLRFKMLPVNVLLVIMVFIAVYAKLLNISLKNSLIISTLSFGFSYAAFVLTCIPTAIIFSLLLNIDSTYIALLAISVIQVPITLLSLKSKRINNGFQHLIKFGLSDVGMYISVAIILSISILNMNQGTRMVYVIPITIIFIGCLTLFFWRKNQITRLYIEQTKSNEIKLLEQSIIEKDKLIDSLRQDNDRLARIIHKDNKLIPSMVLAVKKYISENAEDIENNMAASDVAEVLNQLDSIYGERMEALKKYELNSRTLPSTGITSTDSVMFYMQQRALEYGAEFNLCVSADVKSVCEKTIETHDLNTMLADLIENAVISVKNSSRKSVMTNMITADNIFCIEIYDSGEAFDIGVLKNMGMKKITTHINDGGSGIGLMTLFVILNKYRASLLIEEYENNTDFSKKICVTFDSLNQRKITTPRCQVLKKSFKNSRFVIS